MNQEGNYWASRGRFSRRQVLKTSGLAAGGLAAAALVACGGDDDEGSSSGNLGPSAADSSGPPKHGGTWRMAHATEPLSMDPYGHVSGVTKSFCCAVYSRLFTYKTGPGEPRISFEVIPDAAASMENPEPLRYVVKLNQNVKFTAPISRKMTSKDVSFSYERLLGRTGNVRPGPDADVVKPIDRIETPDDSTIVFHLSRPYSAFPGAVLADARAMQIMPVEAGTVFDPSKEMIGSGPWIFEEYRTGSVGTWRRNPEWHSPVFGAGRPYLDRLEQYIIADDATQVNQFLGGNLDIVGLSAENIKRARDVFGERLQIDGNALQNIINMVFSADAMADTPIKDERVRRAISMSLDRDSMMDAAWGYPELTKMGIATNYDWNTIVPHSHGDYWLDPKTKMSAKNAANFKYNTKEAASLLSAAGVGNGFKLDWNWVQGRYGAQYDALAEMVTQFLKEVKIDFPAKLHEYTVFTSSVLPGNFSGAAQIYYTLAESTNYVTAAYLPGAARNIPKVDDSMINELEVKLVGAETLEERQKHFHAIQERAAEKMYYVPLPQGSGYTGFAPDVRNGIGYRTHGHGVWSEMTHVHWKDA
jgi:peptide/nickel transport system substrate-binding protein